MPRARITRVQYDALLESFRKVPRNIEQAARDAGVHHRTAKHAYEIGWPRPDWARPIKQVLAEEDAGIRAKAAEEERIASEHATALREERERAELDAVGSELRELKAIRAALTNGTALLGLASQLGMALIPSVNRVRELLATAPIDDAAKLITLLGQVVRMGDRVGRMIDNAIKMERRRVGEPGEIVAVQHTATPSFFDAARAAELLDGDEDAVTEALDDLLKGRMTENVAKVLEACQLPSHAGPST